MVYYFYCMKAVLKPIIHMRDSYERVLSSRVEPSPRPLDLALLSNPFLKADEKYKLILHEITLYNRRVVRGEVADEYESLCFERLFEVVGELGNMESREDQVARMGEAEKWWAQQKRIIKQRKDLGVVKYKTDRKIDRLRQQRSRMAKSMVVEDSTILPNEARYAEVFPFEMKYRTAHREMDVPVKRLPEYKRKVINISEALMDEPEAKVGEKVTYPMPKKVEPHQEIRDEQNPEAQQPNVTDPQQPTDGQAPPNTTENPNPEAVPAVAVEDPNKQAEQANQDFGMGLGEQPGEQEDQPGEEEAVNDKLAPKNKIYTLSIRQRQEDERAKTYQRPYLFYRGHDAEAERRMEERAVRRQQQSLQLQREECDWAQRAHEWAAQKSRVDREIMQKLEAMTANRSFAYSFEEPQKKEMLSPADERKYGLSMPVRQSFAGQVIDMQSKLPEIGRVEPIEKEIRRDRLKGLKHKFSTILGLKEGSDFHPISNAETMCMFQTSPRRRNFSMILEEHSLQREKASELQEIQRIKESLGKQRININIRTLAQALVPDSDSYRLDAFASPPKLLPNNPFFVEPKKKKKK